MDQYNAVGGFAAGLNQALQQYFGFKIQNDQASATRQAKTQDMMNEKNYESNLTLNREEGVAKYKQSLEGQVPADMADKLAPGMGLGDTVESFNQKNGRYPTTKEFHELTMAHPKMNGSNSNGVSVPTFLSLLSNGGVDPDAVTALGNDLKKSGTTTLPIGLAEKQMEKMGSGVKDASLMSLLKDDPNYMQLQSPKEKADYFQEVKSAFSQPGKAALKDQDELDKVTQATLKAYQAAASNPQQYPNPMAATAKELSKRYNKAAVSKVMLNVAAANEEGKNASAGHAPAQSSGMMAKLMQAFGGQQQGQ